MRSVGKDDHAAVPGMQLTFAELLEGLPGPAAVEGGREREAAGRRAVQKQREEHTYHRCGGNSPYGGNWCNGCEKLKAEEWPHGAIAVRCMDKSKGRWYGRVLHYSVIGKVAQVIRPVWCSTQRG